MYKAKFQIDYNGDSKVEAIKIIRAATATGLKEAKDFVDAGWDRRYHIGDVLMNQAQFGRLMLEIMSRGFGTAISVRDVQMVPPSPNGTRDFSTGGTY